MAYFYSGLTSTVQSGSDLFAMVMAAIVFALLVTVVLSVVQRPIETEPRAIAAPNRTLSKAA